MIRRVVAVFLALHGIVHVMGLLGSWRLADIKELPYTTQVLNGTVDVGDVGERLVGVLWLVGASAFVVAAIATWRTSEHWVRILSVATVLSLAACLFGLPASSIGVVIDLLILLAIGIYSTFGPAPLTQTVH